jgi:hypothetical protein
MVCALAIPPGDSCLSIKGGVRRALNKVLNPLGFDLNRIPFSDRDSEPASKQMIERMVAGTLPTMRQIAEFFGGTAAAEAAEQNIREFFPLYFGLTLHQTPGSSGFNAALTLFTAARALKPDVIVESGTFEGFGSWALRAGWPDAETHCFDLDFKTLRYRDSAIHYHEHDWASVPLEFRTSDRSLGYFDDHVNQAQRILESAERGLKWLVFDDNVSWHTLHRDGLPPVPTVDMVCDDVLADGERLEWTSKKTRMTYTRNKALDLAVRRTIKRYQRVDNLHDQTGYPSTPMALVELS